jgi:asparagine synthase (glutamine-hydrolysing)
VFAGSLGYTGSHVCTADDLTAWADGLAPFFRPELEGRWQQGTAALLELRRSDGPGTLDQTRVPARDDGAGVALAFWGRLDERRALATRLGLDGDASAESTDADLVLAAWLRWEDDLCRHLVGDFALAVLDAGRTEAFLARDALGVKPLYYLLDGEGLAFATSVAALRRFRGLGLTPDPDWLARRLAGLSSSLTATAYHDVLKLPPGHWLKVTADGRADVRQWHAWRDDAPPASRRDPQWVRAYREVLAEAVRCRIPSEGRVGAENSGGLDSATVTALTARLTGNPGRRLHSFGLALYAQEPELILATSLLHGVAYNHIVTNPVPDPQGEARRRALSVVGHPEVHGSALAHVPFYEECALWDIRALLSGFGGDQAVSNSGAHVYWELQDERRWTALWEVLPGNAARRTLRVARRATAGHRMPEYNAGLLKAVRRTLRFLPLRDDVVKRLDISAALFQRARFSTPYRRVNEFVLRRHLEGPDVPVRLESCTLLAASYGVDYRWPLCDARLVQQYLSTPSIEKLGPGGMGRYLHRRAVHGMVPPSITWKRDKDLGPRLARGGPVRPLTAALERARKLDAALHPVLDDLIDRRVLREQIDLAESSSGDDDFAFCFIGNTRTLEWLQEWLEDTAPC